jgi:hypothetical protein
VGDRPAPSAASRLERRTLTVTATSVRGRTGRRVSTEIAVADGMEDDEALVALAAVLDTAAGAAREIVARARAAKGPAAARTLVDAWSAARRDCRRARAQQRPPAPPA